MDDERRRLERRVQADPSDRAAGWALVEAHERAGDRAAARRVRARLWGDPEAWRALEAPRRGPSGPVQLVTRPLPPGAVLLPGQGEGPVVVALEDALQALEPDDLSARWRVEVTAPAAGRTPAALVGDRVAHVDVAGRTGLELVLRDRATGEEVDRRPCPLVGPELRLVGRLDAVVVLDRTRAVVLETGRGRLGRVVNELVVERTATLGVARDLLLEVTGGVVKGWPLEGIGPRWTRPATRLAAGPPEVVLVIAGQGQVAELEPEQGTTRWALSTGSEVLIAVAGGGLLLAGGRRLVGLSRQGAEKRWAVPHDGRPLALAAAEDQALLVLERPDVGLDLRLHDAADGALRATLPLRITRVLRPDVTLAPREGGLVGLVRPVGDLGRAPVAFAVRGG